MISIKKDYTVSINPNPKYFISWGKGVQSTAMAVMSVLGDIKRVDAIVTAETGWEHPHTYLIEKYYTEWFQNKGIPVYKVQDADISIYDPERTDLPLFSQKLGAPLRRQCTNRYKIAPIRRKMREICGLREDNTGRTLKNTAILYLGISLDEYERMADSNRSWIKNEYPLVDKKFTRQDCIDYLMKLNLPVPMKSSCVICPYKGAKSWIYTKENYPEDFAKAVEYDHKIRTPATGMIRRGYTDKLYLSKLLKPLDEIDFTSIVDNSKQEICDSGYCFI